jgi:hypothetical protein
MLQRRFRLRSPKYPLEVGVRGFYQYLTEHLGDVRSVHVTPLLHRATMAGRSCCSFGPTNKWSFSDVPLRIRHEALKTTRNLVVLLDSLIIARCGM